LSGAQHNKHSSVDIFGDRSRYGGLRAVIDPNDRSGLWNRYLDLLSKRLMKGGIPPGTLRLLDFGCGNGRILKAVARSNMDDICGVDVIPNLIEEAKKGVFCQRPIRFKVIEENPPYPLDNEYFDTVICCWVLQHINDDEVVRSVLKELFRVLRRGGTLVTFDRTSQTRIVQELNGRAYTTIRTIVEEKTLAEEAGFELESVRVVWIAGRFWQRVVQKYAWRVWRPFIPFMVWWDLGFGGHPFPREGERAECLYTMRKHP
jgi:SAM-dependent methyltransferase